MKKNIIMVETEGTQRQKETMGSSPCIPAQEPMACHKRTNSRAQKPALPLTSYMTWCKVLILCKPQLPHLCNGVILLTSVREL